MARVGIAPVSGQAPTFADLAPVPGADACIQPPTWVMGGQQVLATVLLTPGVWLIDRAGDVERLDAPHSDSVRTKTTGLGVPRSAGICDGAVASPDGRYVVYTAGGEWMYLLDLTTGRESPLGAGDLCHGMTAITWAPDSLSFLRWSPLNGLLELFSANDATLHQIDGGGWWPSWSPDGGGLVYWRAEEGGLALWLHDVAEGQQVRLTTAATEDPEDRSEGGFPYSITPRWSPNRTTVAFVSMRSGQPETYLLEVAP